MQGRQRRAIGLRAADRAREAAQSLRTQGGLTVAAAIPEKWMKGYVDQLLEIAAKLPDGLMKDATMLRADHVMDMVKAWREQAQQ